MFVSSGPNNSVHVNIICIPLICCKQLYFICFEKVPFALRLKDQQYCTYAGITFYCQYTLISKRDDLNIMHLLLFSWLAK